MHYNIPCGTCGRGVTTHKIGPDCLAVSIFNGYKQTDRQTNRII